MTLSVSALNQQIQSLLESTFMKVKVVGEIATLTYHNSGHIYFSIKDKNSTIKCVMFKGNAKTLKFRLEVGQQIEIDAALSVYTPRGEYQLRCFTIEPFGKGSLAIAYEQLKVKLEQKGYFSAEHKKQISQTPNHIVLITSENGAAQADMYRVHAKRWPLTKITLLHTIVQGEGSKESIAKNIQYADTLGADVIVVGRGGGSTEDLWAFNEEVVADAIYEANTPIVSAVGHEVDYLISDFVADLRAPTPSAAIEMILPDQYEWFQKLDELQNDMTSILVRSINIRKNTLDELKGRLTQFSIDSKIKNLMKPINELKQHFDSKILQIISQKRKDLKFAKEHLTLQNPDTRLKDNTVQIVQSNKLSKLEYIRKDDIFELQNSKLIIEVKALNIKKNV